MAINKTAVEDQGHPIVSRTSTDELHTLHGAWLAYPEDLTVQQRVDSSAWHRRAVGGLFTACGKAINGPNAVYDHGSVRNESYLEELCTEGCFSPFELQLSARLNKAARDTHAAELDAAGQWKPIHPKK